MRRLLVLLSLAACGDTHPDAVAAPKDAPVAAAPTEDAPVARWKGGTLSRSQLDAQVGSELAAMDAEHALRRYDLETQAVDSLVDEAILGLEAQARGIDLDTMLKREIEEKAGEPTEAQVLELYAMFQTRAPDVPLDAARGYLVDELRRREMSELYGAFVEALRVQYGVERLIPYPDLPRVEVAVSADDPSRGPADAPITIVQFAEYQCYFCNKVSETLDRLDQEYPGKIRLVFKDFPLPSHDRAMDAAIAAHCAGEQEHYWDLNRLMLANQGALEDADLTRYGQQVGLDGEAFASCRASGRHRDTVAAGLALGQQIGVKATPTFFVNGMMVSGAQPYDRFAAVVERELAVR